MPSNDPSRMVWWSPLRRGVLRPTELRVSRSLRKSARRYQTSVDQAFPEVLRACASPDRDGGWIDDRIVNVYLELHQRGIAHSIECWDAQRRLVGGLYGVSFGGLFAGESMFHDPEYGRDASKVALLRLVALLSDEHRDQRLIDVQWLTSHLASLGAQEIPRRQYLAALPRLLAIPEPNWAAHAGTCGP